MYAFVYMYELCIYMFAMLCVDVRAGRGSVALTHASMLLCMSACLYVNMHMHICVHKDDTGENKQNAKPRAKPKGMKGCL